MAAATVTSPKMCSDKVAALLGRGLPARANALWLFVGDKERFTTVFTRSLLSSPEVIASP